MRFNLTQHSSTPEQACTKRTPKQTEEIKALLTFEKIPTLRDITDRARALTDIAIAADASEAMIGGASYLILALDPALRMRGIIPIYAFSKREAVETTQEDGSVVKKTIFRHLGFVRF